MRFGLAILAAQEIVRTRDPVRFKKAPEIRAGARVNDVSRQLEV